MNTNNLNFKQIIFDFADQFQADLEFHNQLLLSRRPFNKIAICGMGGSALVGDIFYCFKLRNYTPLSIAIPIFTHRSYDLPPDTDENTLVICISYSGNTEETISAYEKAMGKSLAVVGITCDGKLKTLFEQNQTPWIEIPNKQIPPRMSLGYQIAALIKIFIAYSLLPQSIQDTVIASVKKIKPADLESFGEELSIKIGDKIPIIYASDENKGLARLWKIKFNENAKIPAFFNSLPELNHNEMNGWLKYAERFHFIFLADAADSPRLQKRFKITADIINELHGTVDILEIKGENTLEKVNWAIVTGDWLSYYIALHHDIDPVPVALMEEFKWKMID